MEANINRPSHLIKKPVAIDQAAAYQCHKTIKSLGICIGASTVSMVQLEREYSIAKESSDKLNKSPGVIEFSVHPHNGNPRHTLLSALDNIDLTTFDSIAATGRNFRKTVNLASISEPEAVEYAYSFVKPPEVSCPAVVSAGGETSMAYILNRSGRISSVRTGNKCASGTGEFFLQQLDRMSVSSKLAARWAAEEEPYHVSGRCSVFCKSDCTHAINKGIPKSKVTAGLCKMMADKILELLKKAKKRNIMVVGGSTQNHMMIEYLRKEIPGLIVPEQAPYFEALGAALWALEHRTPPMHDISTLFKRNKTSFDTLPPLENFKDRVEFNTMNMGEIRPGDICILGLDVGSTTTKAILLRKADNAMLASVYLRTDGDPIKASRQCYQSILEQMKKHVDPSDITIEGLGVCGSGRQIAGLHALTSGVINEIISHAAAAVYFDPQVDTIFEIGGQDAKYTYITNAVASDYAMNEACSAGTGSFLEESAREALGVKMEEIAELALKGKHPLNFNDQCAAFIASDIKNAIHEGGKHEDIVAGLVYSVCMNYNNRVKGNRPVGKKVFMQGGVCYNRAVPLAMASLVGKPIIVPPEPGLMGAFGVALEVQKRIESGLLAKQRFDLEMLTNRTVEYGKSFICNGGKDRCDRRCQIAIIKIEKKTFPFGGACNRYYNMVNNIQHDIKGLDYIRVRQQLVFDTCGTQSQADANRRSIATSKSKQAKDLVKTPRKRIGINRSFLVNTYYPLYSTFFTELGFEPVISDSFSQDGMDQRNAAFCYPAELSHGFFQFLLDTEKPLEYIFLPHFKAVPVLNGNSSSQVCPFVQSETFYLQTAFHDMLEKLKRTGTKVLSPLIDLTKGLVMARQPLLETAMEMGASKQAADTAFIKAKKRQQACLTQMKTIGKQALRDLESDPGKMGVVIFARPYNGFVEEAHMGIPHKFATRGIPAIPFDFLTFDDEASKRHMYWGMGQRILKAAHIVNRHPQLFGTFITNFSCGPDSFIIGYFRELMGRKPSLTLELDSHTADAGLETRIEAFLDIASAYRQLTKKKRWVPKKQTFVPSQTFMDNKAVKVIASSGEKFLMTDPRTTLLIPSMGKIATEFMAAVFRGKGFNVVPHPPSDESVLKLGRGNTSCKECLPLILTTGTLLNYIQNRKRDDEIVVYFMPTSSGPCRFGQYHIFMEDLIRRLEIPNVAMLSLTSENSYGGFGNDFQIKLWRSIVVSDVLEDVRSMLLANATDIKSAIKIFDKELELIKSKLKKGDSHLLQEQLVRAVTTFRQISLRRPPSKVPTISIVGEIFVRRDAMSRQYLVQRLAKKGFATICSPVSEWILYSDYLVDNGLVDYTMSWIEKIAFMIRKKIMRRNEKRLKSILSSSGLVQQEPLDVASIIRNARPYISPDFTGEAILTVGSSLTEVASHSCGVIAIGPFGCMPNRVSEAILNVAMTRKGKLAVNPKDTTVQDTLTGMTDLPFLAIESDGSAFPQLIHAQLEAFCLQAKRLHQRMLESHSERYH
ncbi:MAG: activase [Desulfobacterales bacterium]|nr:MAG: activase [Desulfobacterales bacterium]